MRYELVAEAYRDLERTSGRLELIGRLAQLIRQTPPTCCPPSPCCARARSPPTSPAEVAISGHHIYDI